MNIVEDMLVYNETFVNEKKYLEFETTKFPDKKIVIISCMDTRLTNLLPAALGIKNGDVKLIKNAGGTITHPFGSVMRSILVCIYQFDVTDVIIIGHDNCGMANVDHDGIYNAMLKRGITQDVIDSTSSYGYDLKEWFQGFSCVTDSVNESVNLVKKHPLVPKDVVVTGLVIDPTTGKLRKTTT